MSDPGRPIAEEELHAWIDGQLEPEREAAVVRYLHEQPDVAHRVTAWRDQREALRAAFGPVAAEPIPRGSGWRGCSRAAGATATALAGGSGSAGVRPRRRRWVVHGGQPPPTAAITLMAQQRWQSRGIPPTAGADRAGCPAARHLARWVSTRLRHQVAPPDLSPTATITWAGAWQPRGPAGLSWQSSGSGSRCSLSH